MVNLLFLMTYFVNYVSQDFPGGASIFCWSDNETEKNCNEVGFDVWVGLRVGNNKKTEKLSNIQAKSQKIQAKS